MAVLSQVGELLRAGDVLGVEGAATALTQEGMTLTLSRSSVVKRLGRWVWHTMCTQAAALH